jgi:hypothetical protein
MALLARPTAVFLHPWIQEQLQAAWNDAEACLLSCRQLLDGPWSVADNCGTKQLRGAGKAQVEANLFKDVRERKMNPKTPKKRTAADSLRHSDYFVRTTNHSLRCKTARALISHSALYLRRDLSKRSQDLSRRDLILTQDQHLRRTPFHTSSIPLTQVPCPPQHFKIFHLHVSEPHWAGCVHETVDIS